MVAIGALKPYAQNLSNEQCFRIRKDEQMKTISQWMETHRGARNGGHMDATVISALGRDSSDQRFLTQNSFPKLMMFTVYHRRMDAGDGGRESDGCINLKLRGDLLAALDTEVADEIRDVLPSLADGAFGSVGIDLEKLFYSPPNFMRNSASVLTVTW